MKRKRRSLSLTEQEIYGQLGKPVEAETPFLWRYPRELVWQWLSEAGIVGRLRELGYDRLSLSLRMEGGVHRLKVEQAEEVAPLIDLRLTEESTIGQVGMLAQELPREPLAFLVIQWVSLQDVREAFSAERPQLPGQEYPGLGVGRKLFSLLIRVARELGKDGLVGYPQYYHNAVFYSDQFVFLDARQQGTFLALRRALRSVAPVEASRAVADGRIVETRSGARLEWHPGEMIFPLSRRLQAHYASREYRLEVERTAASVAFRLVRPAPASP